MVPQEELIKLATTALCGATIHTATVSFAGAEAGLKLITTEGVAILLPLHAAGAVVFNSPSAEARLQKAKGALPGIAGIIDGDDRQKTSRRAPDGGPSFLERGTGPVSFNEVVPEEVKDPEDGTNPIGKPEGEEGGGFRAHIQSVG